MLSENEEKILAQMERALAQSDPRLSSRLSSGATPRGLLRRASEVLLGLTGLIALVAGAGSNNVFLGVTGFLCMLISVTLLRTPARRTTSKSLPVKPRGSARRGRLWSNLVEKAENHYDDRNSRD